MKQDVLGAKHFCPTPRHLCRCRITLAWRRSQLHAIHLGQDFCRAGCAADFGAELRLGCDFSYFCAITKDNPPWQATPTSFNI